MYELQNIKTNIKNIPKNTSHEFQELILALGKSLFYVLLISILIYVIYYTYIYYTTPCNKIVPYFTYLTNFGNPAFCNPTPLQKLSNQKLSNQNNLTNQDNNENNLQNNSSNHNDEVFLISNQLYNWEEAKCKCESYGARLATKAELTESYNKGAHWCNYGWIDGNEAYYPVQQCELDKKVENIRNYYDLLKKHYQDPEKYTLQMVNEARNKMHKEHAFEFCGKSAGLNGGKFMSKVKFGATCYGKKPYGMSVREKEAKCEKPKKSLFEEEEEKHEAEKKSIKEKCGGILPTDSIQSFNPDQWYVNK